MKQTTTGKEWVGKSGDIFRIDKTHLFRWVGKVKMFKDEMWIPVCVCKTFWGARTICNRLDKTFSAYQKERV